MKKISFILSTLLLSTGNAFASGTLHQCKMAYLQHHERTLLLNHLLFRGEISPLSFETHQQDNESILELSISFMCKKVSEKKQKKIQKQIQSEQTTQ